MNLEQFISDYNTFASKHKPTLALQTNIDNKYETYLTGPVFYNVAIVISHNNNDKRAIHLHNFRGVGKTLSLSILNLVNKINSEKEIYVPKGLCNLQYFFKPVVGNLESEKCTFFQSKQDYGKNYIITEAAPVDCFKVRLREKLEYQALQENEIKFALEGGNINRVYV